MVCLAPETPLEARQLRLPERLGPGEVLVAMRLATICGSDLHTFSGRRREPMPTVLGHEGVGTILAMGGGRSELALGDRVTWSIADSCGVCPFCAEHDLPEKCVELFKYGHALLSDGTGLNGCYATHLVLRRGTHIRRLPEVVEDRWAVAANCALATVVNAVSRIPASAQSVLVQGAGLLGIFAVGLLRARGVASVYLVDSVEGRLALAPQLGVEAVWADPGDGRWRQRLRLRHPHGLDAALEVAGARVVVRDAVDLLRPGGHYVLAGLVHPDSALDLTGEQLIRKCLTLHAVHNYSPRHLDTAIDFLATEAGRFPFAELISPAIPLADLNTAFLLARSGQWARVAVDCAEP